MQIRADEITRILRDQLQGFEKNIQVDEVGTESLCVGIHVSCTNGVPHIGKMVGIRVP